MVDHPIIDEAPSRERRVLPGMPCGAAIAPVDPFRNRGAAARFPGPLLSAF
jgi:hypothetical protein